MNERRKQKLEAYGTECTWYYSNTCKGTFVAEYLADGHPVPIGVVWFRQVGNDTIEVLQSFTETHWRRCGVRTALNDYIIKQLRPKTVMTATATPKAKKWMLKYGYREQPNGDWTYRVPR